MFFKLLRIKHWTKNFLIFIPLFLSFINNDNPVYLFLTVIGFFAFSFIASSIYIINDIKDIDADKNHPVKKNRPIASGYYSVTYAIVVSIVLIVLSFILLLIMSFIYYKEFSSDFVFRYFTVLISILFLYFITNILYSFYLKHVPIVDIFILALGFILRIYFGSIVISLEISYWFYLTVMTGSFYLGLAKRRNELSMENNNNITVRKVLKYYTYEFLDKHMYMMLTMSLIFYSLWCIDPSTFTRYNIENTSLALTIPFLLLVVMKYNLNIEKKECSADPTDVILGDKILLLLICLYVFVLFVTLHRKVIIGFFV